MHPKRRDYLIARALWDYIARDATLPDDQRTPGDCADMDQILDEEYPNELASLMKLEKHRRR